MTTTQLIRQYNLNIVLGLIPDKSEPIYCTSFEDVNADDYYPYESLTSLYQK